MPFFNLKSTQPNGFTSLLKTEAKTDSVVLPYKIKLQTTKKGILTFDFGWPKMV